MSNNEAETRYELIDPLLREKGYRMPYVWLKTPAPVEPTGPKGRRRNGPGKTDYLLCVEVPNGPKPLPVAILEAKREAEDACRLQRFNPRRPPRRSATSDDQFIELLNLVSIHADLRGGRRRSR